MNKREFAKLKKWTDTLTDEQLKKEYYDAVFKTLGSQAEEMYERGYDIADIREREKYERWLSRQSDMLEVICSERGIKLWEEFAITDGSHFLKCEDGEKGIKVIKPASLVGLGDYELKTSDYTEEKR